MNRLKCFKQVRVMKSVQFRIHQLRQYSAAAAEGILADTGFRSSE